MGRDREYQIAPTDNPRKVVIVGGGPGGMEAARLLARMGHDVRLFEEGKQLGGQLLFACALPTKEEFYHVITFYENELRRLGVKVTLGTKVGRDEIMAEKPDAVIIASGSVTQAPDIPGLDNPNVLTIRQILMHGAPVGSNVVVLGGGNTGCEIADYLSQRGRRVSIMEMGNKIAADIGPGRRYLLTRRLRENGVRNFLQCRIKALRLDRALYIRHNTDGHRSLRELTGVDTFVNAMGMRSRDELSGILREAVDKLFVIGDALHPGKVLDAVAEGAAVAFMIENGEEPVS